jgi:hypothetical protein
MRISQSPIFKYSKNDEVKEYEMGRECSMRGGEKECIDDFRGKVRRKEATRKT